MLPETDTKVIDGKTLIGKTITPELIEKAARLARLNLNQVNRLFLRTYASVDSQGEFDSQPPYLNREAAEYLAALPKLVGGDYASTDHPEFGPISAGAHGPFVVDQKAATMEGLNFKGIDSGV